MLPESQTHLMWLSLIWALAVSCPSLLLSPLQLSLSNWKSFCQCVRVHVCVHVVARLTGARWPRVWLTGAQFSIDVKPQAINTAMWFTQRKVWNNCRDLATDAWEDIRYYQERDIWRWDPNLTEVCMQIWPKWFAFIPRCWWKCEEEIMALANHGWL